MSVEQEGDQSSVRNSNWRQSTKGLDYPVKIFHHVFPNVKANHITAAGVMLSVAGIELMERQHRLGKSSGRNTGIAIGLTLAGMACDLFDGKLARLTRGEMADEEEKLEDEMKGQAYDPMADGIIEAFQSLASACTASKLGRKKEVSAALFNLATCNLPRTFKAVAGIFGRVVPETYKPYDFRFFGTSLGRKFLIIWQPL
ncbi:CDP-alcohol phosphatidyltransferase family protein [Candidatus Daviesbacteria bacterium]|nr:CDP-alcohol phosphatidyltransferase family protein [Candidatus Daviesbacteria bacterium]